MIEKIDRKKMHNEALDSGDYEASTLRTILRKIDELVDKVNELD